MNKNQRRQARDVLKIRRCRYCLSVENLTIDHKIPVSKGGIDDIKNLQVLCKRCNMMKSGLTDGQIGGLWKWITTVDRERIIRGKKPRFHHKTKP